MPMYEDVLKHLKAIVGLQEKMLKLMLVGGADKVKAENINEELLDSSDVKRLLKISDSSLYRLRMSKQIKCKRIAGKWYFYKSSILLLPSKS